jgi:hypothetical protein
MTMPYGSSRPDHLLVSYPCVYDPRQRRITAVDAQGRQQYRQVQAIQLMLFTLGLVRSVWRMPLYRRRQRAQQVLAALQPNLFDLCKLNRSHPYRRFAVRHEA